MADSINITNPSALLPCPFCDAAAELKHREWADHTTKAHYVRCTGCGINGLGRNTAEKASVLWNKRAAHNKPLVDFVRARAGGRTEESDADL